MEGTSGSKGRDTLDGDTIELEEKKHVTVEVSKHALVGKVLAPKPLNRRTVRSMLIRSWGFPKGLYIVDLQMNTFLFNFSEADTPNRIMEDAPWSVLGYLVSLQRWVPEVAIHEVDYDLIPFWVQIHGAPLNGISENNARRIAERMGEVLTVENPFMENKIVRGFMRARVMVDITKPFATGFWVPRGELPKVWVTLSYEKLQGYCYNCGCLGHKQKDCKEKRAMAIWDPSKPRYGPTLGVPPVKPLHLVLSEMGMRQNREATEERSSGAWRHAQAESDKPSETVGELARGGGGNGLQKVTPAIRELQHRNWSGMAPDKKDNEGRAEGYDAGRTEKMDVERDGMGKDDVERQEQAKRYSMYNSLAEAQFGMQAQLLPRMDLKRELIRPGLGPAHLGDLDIEPEDIGLSCPVIIIDVKSPPKCKPYFTPKGPSPIDLDEELSIEEITRCREAIQNSQYKGKQAQGYYQGNDPKENSQLAIWGPRSQTKERETADYIVELPPDEAEQVEDYDGKSLQSSGEQAIVKALSANLSLKRTREGNDEEDPSGNKKTKTSLSQLAERRDEENETQEMEVIRALRDLVSQTKPQVVFLMETKAKRKKMDNVRRRMGFDFGVYVDAIGRSGGLAVLWKKEINIHVIQQNKNFMHMKAKLNNKEVLLTGVYGHPEAQQRRYVWDRVSRLNPRNGIPWACVGDFNEILSQNEKEGVRLHSQSQIEHFRSFVDRNGLLDVPLKGCRFTWCNNRVDGCVKEKIDRVLVSNEWMNLFPNMIAMALPALGSDHSPIITNLNPKPMKRAKEFKFEDYWMEHEDFTGILQRSWSRDNDADNWAKWRRNGNNFQQAVQDWSKKTFKRADGEITKLKLKLQHLCNTPHSEENAKQIMEIKKKIDDLWKQEEMYWHARSRVKWLRHGDQNTRYFHAITVQRRNRNRIVRMKDTDDNWVEEENQIRVCFYRYFTDLFSTVRNRDVSWVVGLVERRVNEDINVVLTRNITLDEVKKAVFDLGPQKAPRPDGLKGSTDAEAYELQRILNQYTSASGQVISINKSGIVFKKGIPASDQQRIANIFRLQVWDSPGKYLGLPSDWDALWVKTLKNIYFPNTDFWSVKAKKDSSWVWRSLLQGRDFLKKHVAWQVGNGDSIRVWQDKWVADGKRIWPRMDSNMDLRVSDLINEDGFGWNVDKVKDTVHSEEIRRVLATPVAKGCSDRRVCPFTADGTYTVKSGYQSAASDEFGGLQVSSNSASEDTRLWRVIWNAKTQPKVKMFLWKVCKNAIPTRANLAKRRMNVDRECMNCHHHLESTEHCLIECPFAKAVWFGSRFHWNFCNVNINSVRQWIEDILNDILKVSRDSERDIAEFFYLLWFIWKTRNERVFEGLVGGPMDVIVKANSAVMDFFEAVKEEELVHSQVFQGARWVTPPHGVVKLNVDAAFDEKNLRGAAAIIVRDDAGILLTGFTKRMFCFNALSAEAQAVKEAVLALPALGISRAVIESDSQVVINHCNGKRKNWQVDSVLANVLSDVLNSGEVMFNHVTREGNKAADFVAHQALKLSLPLTWSWDPPVKLRAIFLQDKLHSSSA
ncbi:reverse transcriptase [Senna tora]|uniref:Reverse transcriptase n=1 Tax=Senna tora TaxID=362788 RepID=A0A834WII0_9FABA|nr:reverse transcriptase [Senna tora]